MHVGAHLLLPKRLHLFSTCLKSYLLPYQSKRFHNCGLVQPQEQYTVPIPEYNISHYNNHALVSMIPWKSNLKRIGALAIKLKMIAYIDQWGQAISCTVLHVKYGYLL